MAIFDRLPGTALRPRSPLLPVYLRDTAVAGRAWTTRKSKARPLYKKGGDEEVKGQLNEILDTTATGNKSGEAS